MARYTDAVEWIALNDSAGDTPAGMDFDDAFDNARNLVSTCLVADVFGVDQDKVGMDVLRVRGFSKPRGWVPLNPKYRPT